MVNEQNYFYLIEQNVNNLIHNKHNCYNSLARVQLLCSILCGNISVYKVDKQTNQYENLTDLYGKQEWVDEDEQLSKVKMTCLKSQDGVKIYFFNIVRKTQKNINGLFLEEDVEGKTQKFERYSSAYMTLITLKTLRRKQKKQSQSNDLKGSSYELFIGNKYKNLGYSVIYHGIEQKLKDQGIDLIVQKENNIIFVQCKNWIGGKFNKLNRKDLQAFAGDCFLFMQKNNAYNLEFNGKQISIHFIVNKDELLDKSAKSFLKYNPFIKFKIIEFSEQ